MTTPQQEERLNSLVAQCDYTQWTLDATRALLRAIAADATIPAPAIFGPPIFEHSNTIIIEWASPERVVNVEVNFAGEYDFFALHVKSQTTCEDDEATLADLPAMIREALN